MEVKKIRVQNFEIICHKSVSLFLQMIYCISKWSVMILGCRKSSIQKQNLHINVILYDGFAKKK